MALTCQDRAKHGHDTLMRLLLATKSEKRVLKNFQYLLHAIARLKTFCVNWWSLQLFPAPSTKAVRASVKRLQMCLNIYKYTTSHQMRLFKVTDFD